MRRRLLLVFAIALCLLLFVAGIFLGLHLSDQPTAGPAVPAAEPTKAAPVKSTNSIDATSDLTPTKIYAHNLLLHKGPNFRFYVPWLRGRMDRLKGRVNPSFDDPDSFFIDIDTGILRANLGDLTNFMNAAGLANSPLKRLAITGNGDQIKLKGTLHKVVPLPIELNGTLSVASGNRIQVHVNKLSVLRMPMKGLLGLFRVSLSDLFDPKGVPGVNVVENDIFFDTQKLLPAPHIRGKLTTIRIANPDLEEVYGNAQGDIDRVEQWRNFIRLREGSFDFGKLTMHHVDLIMIDVSKDPWFDLDLANYQAQLVNGYTRMTPEAGLQIFMPDRREVKEKAAQDISIQWMKNRNLPPPEDVTPKKVGRSAPTR